MALAFLERIYHEAEKVLVHVWEGKRKTDANNPLAPFGLIAPL